MQRTFESLKDNDIEIIVIAYLIKHPELIDTHFEDLNNTLFANSENIKIFDVLEQRRTLFGGRSNRCNIYQGYYITPYPCNKACE